jgi:hypothetical protein
MTRDLVSGGILLVFSVVYYLMAAAIPPSLLADTVGPGGMPKSYGIALGILSILLIAQALYARRRAAIAGRPMRRDPGKTKEEIHSALRAAGMLAIGVVYVIVLPYLGYIVSLALLIGATAWYQERARMRWLWVSAVVGAVLFYVIFVLVLQIAEPAGIWPSFL